MTGYTLAVRDRIGELSSNLQCISFLRDILFDYHIPANSVFFGTGVADRASLFLHDVEIGYVTDLECLLNGSDNEQHED